MTAVFVHGNPETAAVWGPLLDEIGRSDVVCLSPPGFGATLPEGFGATVAEYRAWLVDELAGLGAADDPVDLVGHDWGGGHVLGVAMTRPDLLRSWVSDIVGVFHPDYEWHVLARQWQTPGVGEEAVARMLEAPRADRIARLVERGLTPEVAAGMADGQGPEMSRAVLALYRDAAQPAMARRGESLERLAARPGLGILASEDHFVGDDAMRRRAAARAGARVGELEGLGHWWMCQDPVRGAAVLTAFWHDVAG
jgi:pimeloyl-ACP methyl ester carboxylesterase